MPQLWSAEAMSRKPESPCLPTYNIAGPCAECGAYLKDGLHLVDGKLFDAAHCPICKPLSHDWDSGAVVVGEQMELAG